jgi:hypothetical protein
MHYVDLCGLKKTPFLAKIWAISANSGTFSGGGWQQGFYYCHPKRLKAIF